MKRRIMRAFLTGATGFIGSHLAERLCERGYEVVCLVRPTSDRRWLRNLPVRLVEGSLLDREGLARMLRDVHYIFHVAGVTRARTAKEYYRGNVLTTQTLLEAAEEGCAGLERFIYVSSLSAAGPSRRGRPLTEADPPQPITYYGASKLAAEWVVLQRGDGLPTTIIRPPAVYGPRDPNLAGVLRAAQKGWFALPNGGGAQVSLVHVSDLVTGILLAAENPRARGQLYYISGSITTWREVGRTIERIIGRRLRYLVVPPFLLHLAGEFGELKWRLTGRPQVVCRRKVREILQPAWTCSDAKARSEEEVGLGYRPRMTLEEGLAETIDWYRTYGWEAANHHRR